MNKFLQKNTSVIAALLLILYAIGAILYWPIYFIGWLLNKIAKLLLGISYILLLQRRKGWYTIKGIFKYGPAF